MSDPTPVTYLKTLFSQTEKGRCFLRNPRQRPYTKPNQQCIDSYDLEIVKAIRNSDIPKLRAMLQEGKSCNACNRFGESIMHMACRRGLVDVVKFLIYEAHVAVDVRDDFGRTAMHDACWTIVPNLEVMDLVIRKISPDLLLSEDVRGHTPFHYARKEHWDVWVKFLEERDNILIRRLACLVLE